MNINSIVYVITPDSRIERGTITATERGVATTRHTVALDNGETIQTRRPFPTRDAAEGELADEARHEEYLRHSGGEAL